MQGPIFNESNLSEIAYELDQYEKTLLGDAAGVINAEEGTNNVADDGNYNVQVLIKALQNLGEYSIDSIEKPGIMGETSSFTDEQGFLCNSSDHWFAIRKVHNTWFNLNSTNIEPGPQVVSDFYLDAFLISIKNSGYNIFVVRGADLPLPNREEHNVASAESNFKPSTSQFFIGYQYLLDFYEHNKHRQLNIDGASEEDLEKAIKASLDDMNGVHEFPSHYLNQQEHYNNDLIGLLGGEGGGQSEEDDIAKAIALSLQQNNQ